MAEGTGDSDSYGGDIIDGKNISGRGGAGEVETARDVYGGGSRATGMTNVGEGDGGARLTEVEGVALCELSARETTEE